MGEPHGSHSHSNLTASIANALIEAAPDAIVAIDGDGSILLVNAQTERMFGYTRDELLGRPVEVLMPERYRSAHVTHRGAYGEEPQVRPMGTGWSLMGRRKDGTEFPVDISLSPARADGVELFIAAVRDITTGVLAAFALQESEQRFRTIFEQNPVGMAIVGPDLRIRETNAAFGLMLGYAPDELAGLSFADLTHPDDIELDVDLARQVFAGTIGHYTIEKRYFAKHGGIVWVRLTATIIRDAMGRISHGLGITEDITPRKSLERARLMFLQNAAHELRTPLVSMGGLAEMLAEHFGSMTHEQVVESLTALRRQGERSRALASDMLTLFEAESGQLALEVKSIPTDATIAAALEGTPIPAGLEVRTPGTDAVVVADPQRLEQILSHLLSNAARHATGTIDIEVSATGAWVDITVSDDGPGVAPELVEPLFDPFARGRTPIGSGSGMGLTLGATLAEAMGGTLLYSPGASGGARFTVTLRSAP